MYMYIVIIKPQILPSYKKIQSKLIDQLWSDYHNYNRRRRLGNKILVFRHQNHGPTLDPENRLVELSKFRLESAKADYPDLLGFVFSHCPVF